MNDRHPCACRECPCPSSASVAGRPCPSCSVDVHRPSRAVQEHLAEGAEEWGRLLASSKVVWGNGQGPDKPSDAARAWIRWHNERGCPVDWGAIRARAEAVA